MIRPVPIMFSDQRYKNLFQQREMLPIFQRRVVKSDYKLTMKINRTWVLLVTGLLCWGCAGHSPKMMIAAVGPSPSALERLPDKGTLLVYSALDLDNGNADIDLRSHSSYKIFGEDLKLVEKVYNRTGTYIADPRVISLLPGSYVVEARAAGIGLRAGARGHRKRPPNRASFGWK